MGGWGSRVALGLALAGALAGCEGEQGAVAVGAAEGFRACTEAQWEQLTSGDELVDPIRCEYDDADWNGAAAHVIRVEHDVQCGSCWYGSCENETSCPSQIVTIAENADGMVWISEVEADERPLLVGEALHGELGFNPVDVIGLPLEKGAELEIVGEGDGLCLRVAPSAPLSGSYTDCGDAMPEIDLDYAEGILPFDAALAALGGIQPIEGEWNNTNVTLLYDEEDPSASRWSLRVHATHFEVDMQGNYFRKD